MAQEIYFGLSVYHLHIRLTMKYGTFQGLQFEFAKSFRSGRERRTAHFRPTDFEEKWRLCDGSYDFS